MFDYIKNKHRNKSILFTDTDSFETETENDDDDFSKKKSLFHFSNYSAESKYDDDPNALFFDKIKDEMGGFATEEFF